MNIYANPGDLVVFAYPDAGYEHHQKTARIYLKPGQIYTVGRTEVGDWHTDIRLVEFKDIFFNSCHFEDYKAVN